MVAALSPVLRGEPGRNPDDNDDTTKHLSGRSVRVLASGFGLRDFSKLHDDAGERSREIYDSEKILGPTVTGYGE